MDIVSVISETVSLKKSGRKYRGLCPFHNEKTPSFYVDELKQLFYCFGCTTGGDTFKYVMLMEGVDFPEALRQLARRAGITVPTSRERGRPSERQALLAACRDAASSFRTILRDDPEGSTGRNYLRKRGVSDETAEALGIGFAPDQWDTLKIELPKQGHRPEVLMAAGLLAKKEGGNHFYDRFRNRIIFPILSPSGDVIAFGGRILGDGEPKYLNSQETHLYNKRDNLYGLYTSRHAIKEAGVAVIVEGYLDYVALYQAGIRNAVATLGTSFTDEQVRLLRRFTEKVILNYDTDAAGESAAKRSLERLLGNGMSVQVLQLPSGKDPDSFLQTADADDYRALLQSAPNCFKFLVDSAVKDRDLNNPSDVAAAVREVVPVMATVPSRIERSKYVGLLAEKLGVEDGVLLAEIRDALMKEKRSVRGPRGQASEIMAKPPEPVREAEARLLRGLVEVSACRAKLLPEILPADLDGSKTAGIIRRIADMESNGSTIGYPELSTDLSENERALVARIAMRGDPPPDENEAAQCLFTLRRFRLIREQKGIQKEMEGAPDPARLEELMMRKLDLSRQIDKLS
jgi:DNA primase